MEGTTYSGKSDWDKPLTVDSIRAAASAIYKKPDAPKPFKPKWFERLMNRLGWYRQTEVLVFDSRVFEPRWTPFDWKAP